jgi:hypothetical protein
VTSTFDFANDSLVNTGDQVFSGTVAGSDPVAGPSVKCMLQVIGTGKDADANPTFDFTGHCDFQDK